MSTETLAGPAGLDTTSFQNNPLLLQILDSLYEGVIIVDRDGVVVYLNRAYSRITGEQASVILHKPVLETDPDARIVKVLSTRRAIRGAYRDINGFQFLSDMSPIFNGTELIGAIGIVHDCMEVLEQSKRIPSSSAPRAANIKAVAKGFQTHYSFENIIGDCEVMDKAQNVAKRVSNSDIPVLITGESGTGKELFAHAIHSYSERSNKPFVAINCASFPPTLLQSELFGYEEGAFTGAIKGGKAGLFEISNNGTLFLDEIGEMEYELQAKLLRVLETGEFLRVGGIKYIRSNVRLISATNQDLSMLVSQKRFRSDLWFRLSAAAITIPPLRERGAGDIRLLVAHYLTELNKKLNTHCTISPQALAKLSGYSFPGNVRELINILQYAVLCADDIIETHHLQLNSLSRPQTAAPFVSASTTSAVQKAAREELLSLLKARGHSVEAKRQVAAELGISLATLYNRMKEYGIPKSYQ